MPYKLIISKDDRVLKEHLLPAGQTLVGRRPHNDLVLEDPTVSGKHAIIRVQDDEVEIEDLGSTNGTYVNGDPIARQELQLGDRMVIGPYRISLQLQIQDAWANAGSAPSVMPTYFQETSRGVLGQQQTAFIEITAGPNAGRHLPLTKVVTTIGTPGVGVISLTHRLDGFLLAKVEGEDPVTLNGQPIEGSVKLKDGDKIQMASIGMVFRLEQA
ncbi:FHA domain-containing protein [Corticibacter populi]|nr:FHA domain-containing protein [Corticibacter populi]RZS33352.1 FHA domain-containing protein [Corticibacter populi]